MTKTFWIGLTERSVSTFVQAFLAALATTLTSGGQINWNLVLQTALYAGLLAVAKGFAAYNSTDTAVAQYQPKHRAET